ncbi:MAG: hypothetical protein KIT09_01765 [Bryobacteraceae bacterium]|nr:hypothetical protein [Bryobacteraceae bacterium]
MFDALAAPLSALALAVCVYFSLALKRDVRRIHLGHQERTRTLTAALSALELRVNALEQSVTELNRKTATLPQLSPPKPGMTESRRVQVLRMYKRGERAEQIAAALGLPLNEVDLLVKVHQLVHFG